MKSSELSNSNKSKGKPKEWQKVKEWIKEKWKWVREYVIASLLGWLTFFVLDKFFPKFLIVIEDVATWLVFSMIWLLIIADKIFSKKKKDEEGEE